MYFKDIVGHEAVKGLLTAEARSGRTAHARLLCGGRGVGKLPLAIAFARYLMCGHRGADDACGQCASCRMFDRLAHPDLHFVFPVVKRKGKDTASDDFLPEWREMLARSPYCDLPMWLQRMEADNLQAHIFVKESEVIARKLSLKPSRGGYRVVIVWLPERMVADCSNKLLKLLEEPSDKMVFLLVCEEPDALLPTILSRTQRLHIGPIADARIEAELTARYGLAQADAAQVARYAAGSMLRALQCIHLNEDREQLFELFVSLMRLAYQRKIRELKQWSELLASMGRERQKLFLTYCLEMIRENFVCNFGQGSLTHLNAMESGFASRFAPFVCERNIMNLMDEFNDALRHIEQNVNARMVFFHLALKTIVMLVQK